MHTDPLRGEPRIVHLAAGPHQTTDGVAADLAVAGIPIETVTDVYAALASASLLKRAGHGVVLVACADELLNEDLELFSLLEEFGDAIKTFVYGDRRSAPLIQSALDRGASNLSHLPEHLARIAPCRPSCTPERPEESRADAAILRLNAAAPAAPIADKSAADTRDDKTPESAVRVPWLRYADAPRRIPPTDRPRATRIEAGADSGSNPTSFDSPLLTRAELDALLSDLTDSVTAPARQERST
ncbi:MAG: hypothetical protein KJ057_10445 [Phycisphaerae bacterium]|nr:MAG: hypothetical protein EDS66_13445 [Planctomycetota bacterium]KAB2949738.1 MAG: hypothetical protein F9K17_02040 [Phycisphaerae bacterium]MCK6464541.1 hypothetical protein [Phycisphaerae bacterium]MCL4718878.1 hypothetical protein [Phycisphaerae bacterium]MCQ3921689.1 hypothetical protein [Planctomycetota bacterium]